MKNKMITTMVSLLLVILLAGAIAIIIIIYNGDHKAGSAPSIDEVLKNSVDVPEITTNLKSNNYIKISLKIETDNKKAKSELEKRDFQVKDSVIKELSETSASEMDGIKGKEKLTNILKNKINSYMQNGKVIEIYITSYVIQ
ncbi:flagellar basal body-associated protein FliL [Heyndrickxia sp. NPDC080065]|uniref:flagellar basal body-associated protein FliL n=1 Tax=Heyndrickxia sp. NPDC080065 TaxID=3390568 RepID=UPI003D058B8B